MRIDPHQKWNPIYLLQPLYNLVLAAFFEWGVAAHDLDYRAIRSGDKSKDQVRRELRGTGHKAWRQIVWSYSIIFCGHFPDQTYTFSKE